ncbi:hypothetical protein [Pseudobdellovibrio exovorus]|uniref:Transglutaminase-like domain-containing protein n=1 Tax=Pseudobdellovibrio exovorus JSS TaxID=1184267 RepID=M4VDZ1_9BACT|nr:hypothetical protein [Pseudobdellovibrio exovorus]AGH96710.1 hypothetical protein A11Q_2494 [Pseudobdellovibrio exovorus JSS]
MRLQASTTFLSSKLWAVFTAVMMLGVLQSTKAEAAGLRCQNLMQETVAYQVNLPQNLRTHRESEVNRLSAGDVNRLNSQMIQHLKRFVPARMAGKASGINLADAQRVLKVISDHPVTGHMAYDRYNRPDENVGFCFGRAAFTHLLLLKMGLSRDSIVKVWAVGPMRTPGVTWDFHVASAAYVNGKGWLVLDTNYDAPMKLETWFGKMQEQNRQMDRKLRLYVTEPNKFGLELGKYDRIQMGLDLNRENDWYQHYFVDMMNDLSSRSLADYGLQRLPVDSASRPSSGNSAKESSSAAPSSRPSFWDRWFRR